MWASDMNAKTVGPRGQGRHPDARSRRHRRGGDRQVAREVGDVDVLFNCAGIVHHGSHPRRHAKDWDQAFAVNVKSMFLVSRAFIPGMLKKGRGSIINMASVASSIRGLPNRFVYGASKAAVIGLTKSIAADYVGKASAATPSAPARSTRRRCRGASTPSPIRCRRARTSSRASRWAAWARWTTSPGSSCSSPRTSRCSPPGTLFDRWGNDDMKLCRYGKPATRNPA